MHGFIKSIISSNVKSAFCYNQSFTYHHFIYFNTCSFQYLSQLIAINSGGSTILDKIRRDTCHVAEKRLLLPPLPLFNVTVMLSLSRTLTYMLIYNIDLGDGGDGKWPYRTDKVLQVNS